MQNQLLLAQANHLYNSSFSIWDLPLLITIIVICGLATITYTFIEEKKANKLQQKREHDVTHRRGGKKRYFFTRYEKN